MGAGYWEKRIESNRRQAVENKLLLAARGVILINLIGSSGAGKTEVIRRTHEILQGRFSIQVVQGSAAAQLDIKRLQAVGIPSSPARTGRKAGYLRAGEVGAALRKLPLPPGSLVFIENPGELFSPVDFHLGEHCRVLVHSIAGGDDAPAKFPRAYAGVDLVLLNKIDLLSFSGFSRARFTAHLRQVNPDAEELAISCRTGVGLNHWRDWLLRFCGENPYEESARVRG
ncbi:MAG: hydrogenase nickel incorporation protein HypB [Clostridia bacterium]|nr:hydrogenase nickel incorporation protein HypB [Clostridia bacterium]